MTVTIGGPSRTPQRQRRVQRAVLASLLSTALLAAASCLAADQASLTPQKPLQGWAAMADKDVDFSLQWFKNQSILAVYPDPAAFEATMAKARQQADADIQHVTNFEGYRQTLAHFFSTFNDAHAYVWMQLQAKTYQWPGFLARYQGGRFLVAGSDGSVANGSEITACDGQPMRQWSERIALYEHMIPENIIPGLESTHARTAPIMFRYRKSPFLKRPEHCTIDGRSVVLDWKSLPQSDLTKLMSAIKPDLGTDVAVTPFGANGAWVRLGNFSPANRQQSDQFQALYRTAPSLRDKSVIVLDVRGNEGGPYEWFMGVLRALYGNDYTNYYARERLKISAVYRLTKQSVDTSTFSPASPGPDAPAAAPPDGITYDEDNKLSLAAMARGDQLLHAPANAERIAKPKRRPINPVHARVLVLTDYDCGSACIGFVDELKQFPGVLQVGTETFVDARTGSPMTAMLPSGNGGIAMPYMTRDGRPRNDNVPQKPDIAFTGNIDDTAAVQAWLEQILSTP
ncbi:MULTISPECIES: S41 family peptidase [Xanthomonas]|uniref:S41 family peptidase n=1 Tax=Xanthomonas TaxID=338 RepID=UPI000A425BCF|nr:MULTISPECIES: S41 family peptidase [Xanthomonas]